MFKKRDYLDVFFSFMIIQQLYLPYLKSSLQLSCTNHSLPLYPKYKMNEYGTL
jgi:hypothetical protein